MPAFLFFLAVLAAGLFIFTEIATRRVERRFPAEGEFLDLGGYRLHLVHVRAAEKDLPPLVFLHGASGNLRDQMLAFRKRLEGRADLLFVDRPGHGYSERGPEANGRPDGQARAVAQVLELKGIDSAVIVGHSLGCVIAANFAVSFPSKTAGLVLLAPATHPWPGGIAWYVRLASRGWVGRLFSRLLAMPAGLAMIAGGVAGVFAPNAMPEDYAETAPELGLRPASFRANAIDLSNLHAHVRRTAASYRDISAPTVVITGDSDGVVLPDLHARGLQRDIAGAELVWLKNVGHKPDYVATDLAIAAIEKVAGRDRDLQALARRVEERVSDEAAGAAQMPLSPSEPI